MKDESQGKGRPTPTRKEAEEARRKQMKQSANRKQQAARDRQKRDAARKRELDALNGIGDPAYLPSRDKGPVRAMTRDFIDRRFTVGEFMLPALVVILVVGLIPYRPLAAAVYNATLILVLVAVLDTLIVWFLLRRELRRRYDKAETKGALTYGVLRLTQMRPLRRPKPAIGRGEQLRERY